MAPVVPSGAYSVEVLQTCLQYVTACVDSLAAGEDIIDAPSTCQSSSELNVHTILDLEVDVCNLLSQIRTARNLYSKINALPGELLAIIFENLLAPFPLRDSGNRTQANRWLRVTSVCRYWRQVAISTPSLWTEIHAPYSAKQGSTFTLFASLCLERSGALPLSLCIGRYTNPPLIQAPSVARALPRIREIFWVAADTVDLRALTSAADTLEILEISMFNGQFTDHIAPFSLFDDWKTPHLHTVVMRPCTAWQTITFRHLRCLILTHQIFRFETVVALFGVLSLNSSLEDLIIEEFETKSQDSAHLLQLLRQQQPVNMPHLKRIHLSDSERRSVGLHLALLLDPRLVPCTSGCAKRYSSWHDLFGEDPAHDTLLRGLFSPTSLQVSPRRVLATDGHSATSLRLGSSTAVQALQRSTSVSEVEELWLLHYSPELERIMLDARKVRSLTFFESSVAKQWLERIMAVADLFPVAEEIHLMARDADVGTPLLRLLHVKKAAGRRLQTLRFMRPTCIATGSQWPFYTWRSSSWKFARLVDHVFFDELAAYPVLRLPSICTTESTSHCYWKGWKDERESTDED